MVKDNILEIKKQIPGSVTIVAVTKGRSVEEIKEALDAGITDIGENRVQEALLKHEALRTMNYEPRAKWHMVGHLQSNKVKEAVEIFDLIQSVDTLDLARKIGKEAAKVNKIQDILIEVKTSQEATKFGFSPDKTAEAVGEISKLQNIRIQGLMTIAPLAADPEKSRPYFKALRELRDRINSLQLTAYSLQLLSMGMTDDFKIAIEEGSNMIRLGRALFERKNG